MSDPFSGKMPAEAACEFNAIRPAVGDLCSAWQMYRDLFGDEQYAAIMDEWAPAPFLIIHRALRSHILMAFGRLLDPPESIGRKGRTVKNLSICHLVKVIQPHCDTAFHSRIEEMVETARRHCEPLRKWRDKRFAHADRDHTPPLGAEKLPEVDEKHLQDAVAMLKAVLNEIFVYFNGPEVEFPFPVLESCADELMKLVGDGIRFHDAEVDRMLGFRPETSH